MMDRKELEELLLGNWHTAKFVEKTQTISTNPQLIRELLELTNSSDSKVAWRSAYLLDKIHDDNPENITPLLDAIIQKVTHTQNFSIKRHFLRILTQHDLHKKVSGSFINACFKWIHAQNVKVAVKVHAMQLLYNLSLYYPELKQELQATLQELPTSISPGIKNRAQNLLSKF